MKLIRGIFFVTCCVFVTGLRSQQKTIDSLLTVLEKVPKEFHDLRDTIRLNTLLELSGSYYEARNFQASIETAIEAKTLCERTINSPSNGKRVFKKGYCKALNQLGGCYSEKSDFLNAWSNLSKALKVSKDINDPSEIATSLLNLGFLFELQGNNGQAVKYYMEALEISKTNNDIENIAASYQNLASFFLTKGDYPKVLDYLFRQLKIHESQSDFNAAASCYLMLGNTYYEMENTDKALETYKKALGFLEKAERKAGVAVALNNIANIYMTEGNDEKGLEYYLKSLKISQELKDTSVVIFLLNNIGSAYLRQKKFDLAEDYYSRSLSIIQNSGFESGLTELYLNFGRLYYKKANSSPSANKAELFQKAKESLDRSLSMATKEGNRNVIKECLKTRSDFYQVSGNYKEALVDYKRYSRLRDSLLNDGSSAAAVRSEMNYEFDKKEDEAKAEQERKDAIVKQEKEKQMIIRNAFIGGFLLMLVLALVIFRGYRNKRKSHFIISKQKLEVEHQKHLVEQKQKQIIDSINYAKRIQSSILVDEAEIKKHLDAFILYIPKDIVSGDFYWFHSPANGKPGEVLISVADCTGHGVPGAFLSMVGSTLLNEIVNYKNITDPAKIITELAKGVSSTLVHKGKEEYNTDGMDISICKIDTVSKKISFAAANHYVYLVDENGLKQIDAQISSVNGIFGLNKNESASSMVLDAKPGSMLYMSTDGYADQIGELTNKKLLASRFEKILSEICHLPAEEQKTVLEKKLNEWKGNTKQIDDILVVGFRI
jgi:tetratricopeptide (TPR) repeat protein